MSGTLRGKTAIPLLTAVTTGASAPIDLSSYVDPVIFFTGAGTISAGTALVEESDDPTYSGSWSLSYSLTCSTLSGGVKLKVCLPAPTSYRWLRVRLSVDISGSGGLFTATLAAAE